MTNDQTFLLTCFIGGVSIISVYGAIQESPRTRRFLRDFFAFIFGGSRNLRRKKILDAIKFPLRGKDSKDSGLRVDQLYDRYFSQYLTEDEFDYLLLKNNYIKKCDRNTFDPCRWKIPRPTGEMLLEPMGPYLKELKKELLRRSLSDRLDAWKYLKGVNSSDELRYTQKSYLKQREMLQQKYDRRSLPHFWIILMGIFPSPLVLLLFPEVENKALFLFFTFLYYFILTYFFRIANRKKKKIFNQRARVGVKEMLMREEMGFEED